MAKTAKIEVKDQNLPAAFQTFLKALLQDGNISALLVSQHLPMKNSVMPTLVTDPEKLNGVDPFAPVFPINAAKVVSKLTRRPMGSRIAVVLRPCEIRAFIELVKLKQGSLDDVVLVGTDCLGAYGNVDYPRFAGEDGIGATVRFYENVLTGKGTAWEDFDLSPACKACEFPIPDNADLLIGLLGVDINEQLLLKANTPAGEELLDKLGLPKTKEPEGRKKAIDDLVGERIAYRDQMFAETSEATSDLEQTDSLFGQLHQLLQLPSRLSCLLLQGVCLCHRCV